MDKDLFMLIKNILLSVTYLLCFTALIQAGDQASDNEDDASHHEVKSGPCVPHATAARKQREGSVDTQARRTPLDDQRPRVQPTSVFTKFTPACFTKAVDAVGYYTRCTRSLVLDAIRAGTFFKQYTSPATRTCAVTEAVTELDEVIEEKKDDDPVIRQGEIVVFALSQEAREQGLTLPTKKALDHVKRSKDRRRFLRTTEKRIIKDLRNLGQAQEELLMQLEASSDTEQDELP